MWVVFEICFPRPLPTLPSHGERRLRCILTTKQTFLFENDMCLFASNLFLDEPPYNRSHFGPSFAVSVTCGVMPHAGFLKSISKANTGSGAEG